MNRKLALLCVLAFSYAGLCSSVPSSDATANHLQLLLKQKDYVELERSIDQRLSTEDNALFSGIIANRKNRVDDSIKLLAPLAGKLASQSPSWREKELLKTLADDYSKSFQYAKSGDMFSILLKRYSKVLSQAERRDASDRRDEMQLLRSAPPQTVELNGPFILPATRNPVGMIEIPVEVNGKTESWVLDTGANTSVITESTARSIGLQILKGSAQTGDYTGISVSYRVGMLPLLKIGNAVFHNVELPVAADNAFNFNGYQIQGIIGFPLQSALGRITVYADGHVGVDSESAKEPGSELFMEGQTPIAVANAAGAEHLFVLDTGATGSTFGPRFAKAVKSQLTKKMLTTIQLGGAGGTRSFRAYHMDRLSVTLGGQGVTLPTATILSDTGSSFDIFFGSLGQDILGGFKSYTIDFQNMTFIARK